LNEQFTTETANKPLNQETLDKGFEPMPIYDEKYQKTQEPMNSEESKLYPLDWKTTDVKLAKGRFTHTVSRPLADLMIERENELNTETPIAKDGSYDLPDETAMEEVDAKYYEKIKINAEGYGDRDIPTLHKAKAFQSLFVREIYVDDDCDIFDEEIEVIEEVGSGDEADFTIGHILRQPEEKELRKIRQSFRGGKLAPDKRGRQKFVEKSNLRKAMMYYSTYIVRIKGASVGDEKFSPERRAEFIANVNPLIQRRVVKALVEKLTGSLLD